MIRRHPQSLFCLRPEIVGPLRSCPAVEPAGIVGILAESREGRGQFGSVWPFDLNPDTFMVLVAGWWFGTWLPFFHILGMSPSQLTFTPSFFRGVGRYTTNQAGFMVDIAVTCCYTYMLFFVIGCFTGFLRTKKPWIFWSPMVQRKLGWISRWKSGFSCQPGIPTG